MKKFLLLIVYCLPLLAGLQAPARAQRTKLSVQQGGTGDTVLAPRYGVMLGDSLDPVIVLAPGDTNFVLTSRGPGLLPAWLPASGGVSQVYGLAPIFVNGGDTIGIGSIAFADSSRASHFADSANYVVHGGALDTVPYADTAGYAWNATSLWQLGGGAYPFPAIVPVGDSSVVVTANLYVYNNGTAQATGYGNILFGDGADDGPLSVTGNWNIAGGTGITITGDYSIAVGAELTVGGYDGNAVFGQGNVEAGAYGLMSGYINTDSGSYDFTAGAGNQILSGSSNAVALGVNNVSSGITAVSIGNYDSAFSSGDAAVAIGSNASAFNNIVINSTESDYVSNPVSYTVNLGADSGLYVFQPGNPVPELLVNGGTLSSQGTQLTDNTGRVLNGGNGIYNLAQNVYSYIYQGDSIPNGGQNITMNIVAFNQNPVMPNVTVNFNGTVFVFAPTDTTGEGGNPITVFFCYQGGGTGPGLLDSLFTVNYGVSYNFGFWTQLKITGQLAGQPFDGWLNNTGGNSNQFIVTDDFAVPFTGAIQNGDVIVVTQGSANMNPF